MRAVVPADARPRCLRVAWAALWLALACGEAEEHAAHDAAAPPDAAAPADAAVPSDASLVRDGSRATDAAIVEADAASPGPEAGTTEDAAIDDRLGPARSPAELALRGAEKLDDNQAGLIGATRLAAWLEDWVAARPVGVTGDLVILQLNALPGAAPYARVTASDGSTPTVRAYGAAELAGLVSARSNGLVALGGAPEQGLRMDVLLRKYRLRPSRDFVLLAAGELTPGALDTLARAWLTLRYWGVPHAALGLLGVPLDAVLTAEQRTAVSPAPPVDGTERVSDLRVDHFSLFAELGAVRAALATDTLIDVRSAEQYAGTELGPSARDNSCTRGVPHCTPLFSGRIAGAVRLPWSRLVDPASGALRSRAEIDAALRNAAIDVNRTAIVYDDDDQGAALVSFALLAVAGVPARWYGGSYLEWGALNASHPEPALRVLDSASPHRTDVFPELSTGALRWAPLENGVRPLVLDPGARTLDRVLREDRAYKRDPSALPPPGQGDNPCIL